MKGVQCVHLELHGQIQRRATAPRAPRTLCRALWKRQESFKVCRISLQFQRNPLAEISARCSSVSCSPYYHPFWTEHPRKTPWLSAVSNQLLQCKNGFKLFRPTLRNLQSQKNTLHNPDTVPNDYTAGPVAVAWDGNKERREGLEPE